jgi:hypothetical protein
MQAFATTSFIATATHPGTTDPQQGWVPMLLREFGRSQASGFLLDLALWTGLGAVLGAALAVVTCGAFSRWGWYDSAGRFARGLRWMTFAVQVLLATLFVGLAAFWSGAIRGTERVLAQSQLASVFPEIGNTIADGMAWIQLRAQPHGDTNEAALTSAMEEFRAGKWELHATRFLQKLDTFREESVTNLVARLQQSALENAPQLKGGFGEKLLHYLLHGLGRRLVEQNVASGLKSCGADHVYQAIRLQLPAEAAKAGGPETISRREISDFLVRDGIVPGILKPIRFTARAQQTPLLLLAGLVLFAPPIAFRLARKRLAQPNSMATPPSPIPTARE